MADREKTEENVGDRVSGTPRFCYIGQGRPL